MGIRAGTVRTIRKAPFRRISGSSKEGLLYAGTHKAVFKWWDDGECKPEQILERGTTGIDASFIDNGFVTVTRAGIVLYVYDGELAANRENTKMRCTEWGKMAKFPNL